MNFAIICPISGLERYAVLSKTHLVLAQIKDERYRSFYKKRRELGDTIILDNGAYEEGRSINNQTLAEAARYYSPQYVVCPDELYQDWERTYAATKNFLDHHYDEFRQLGCKFIGVPQTTKGNILGWMEGLIRMVEELPLDGIGLPRALCTHYYIDPLTRVRACEFLKRRYEGDQLYIHAFGMVKGNVDELNMLRDVNCNSIDSSAPVWRAWTKGLSLTHDDHQRVWDKLGTECDFKAQLPIESTEMYMHNQILTNLEAVGVDVSSARR
jgi:hypothetical protein